MKLSSRTILFFFSVILVLICMSCGEEELVDLSEEQLQEYFAANNINPERTASGLYYIIHDPGIDTLKPTRSSTVIAHYRGYFLNGEVFDSSYDRGAPSEFSLRAVIAGWTEGIPLFGVGGSGSLYIPSDLAYGPNGSVNGTIPPNTPIAFDIELIEIK